MQQRNSSDEPATKAQFAVLCGVHKSRVSHWIADGKIDGAALVGEGREQKIRVEIAKEQLRQRLDPRQMAGNGLDTDLKSETAKAMPSPSVPPAFDTVEDQIKQARLEGIEFDNRRKAEEEAVRCGRYVLTADVTKQFGRLAGQMIAQFEAWLPDLATDLAVTFRNPERDVLHRLRTKLRELRAVAAGELRAAADAVPTLIDDPNSNSNPPASSGERDDEVE